MKKKRKEIQTWLWVQRIIWVHFQKNGVKQLFALFLILHPTIYHQILLLNSGVVNEKGRTLRQLIITIEKG